MTFRALPILMIAVLSTLIYSHNAAASKARLDALGQSANGSFFILDNRDIFLNPATVNDLPNNANFEWGGPAAGLGLSYANSAPPTAKAEGGAIYKFNSVNLGLQLGRLGDSTQAMMNAFGAKMIDAEPFYPQNSIDIIAGAAPSDTLKWGAGLHYARSVSNTGGTVNYPEDKARELSLSGGAELGAFTGYLKLDLLQDSSSSLASGGSVDFTGKPGGELGLKFAFDAADAASLVYTNRRFSFNDGVGTQLDDNDERIRADYFRSLLANEKTMLFFTVGLLYDAANFSADNVGTNSVKYSVFTSPLVLGIEHKALSWLSLRASVAQNVLIDQSKRVDGINDFDRANLEDTTIGAGLSVYVGNFQIDGTFQGADDFSGRLNASELAENVSLSYMF